MENISIKIQMNFQIKNKTSNMQRINIKKLGLATGSTAALLYLGCAIVMLIAGHDGSVKLANSLMHGIDISTIIMMDMPFSEGLIGIVETFIIGWLIGASIAAIYNIGIKDN